MTDRMLRAIWFALFASVGLTVGGFVMGYGAAMLGSPGPPDAAPAAVLPTLEATPDAGLAADGKTSTLEGELDTSSEAPGLVTSLESLDVNTVLGGVELSIRLDNNSNQEVSFSFSPSTDLSVTDDLGRRYALGWAEFDGAVKVPPRGRVRLVRAFFSGLPDEEARHLVVEVAHPPQLPRSSWQVPVSR